MNQSLFRFHPRIRLLLFFILALSLNACVALDGIFPKLQPAQSVDEEVTLIAESQPEEENIIEPENPILTKRISELEQVIKELRQQQKLQKQDFQLLQEQWETNFVLLERSVADSLKANKGNSGNSTTQNKISKKQTTASRTQKKSSQKRVASKKENKQTSSSNSSPPKLETYSLFQKMKSTEAISNQQNLVEVNNLDVRQDPVLAEEEPGFPTSSIVNPEDLEDPIDLPDPAARAIDVASSVTTKSKKTAKVTPSKPSGFNDPDLNPPAKPRLLIRHAGVKKIYNQGMTSIIQEKYEQAIRIFQNFTQRFPDDLDSDNAYYWIGHSHFELGRLKKAEEAFRNVLKLYEHRPTSQGYKTPDAIYMLGKLYKKEKKLEKSNYFFNEAIIRFPGSAAAKNAKRDSQN